MLNRKVSVFLHATFHTQDRYPTLKPTIMKTNQILIIAFLLCIFNAYSQDSKKDSISTLIKEKYAIIEDKEKESEFTLNFLNELIKANIKENAQLIDDKNIVLNKLKTESILLKIVMNYL